MSISDCVFCQIVQNGVNEEIFLETENILGFMDIRPVSDGHCLFITRQHFVKLHEVPNNILSEVLIQIKNAATALELKNYNILQNNGLLASQSVFHIHWHLIPKPNENQGLNFQMKRISDKNQHSIAKKLRSKLNT